MVILVCQIETNLSRKSSKWPTWSFRFIKSRKNRPDKARRGGTGTGAEPKIRQGAGQKSSPCHVRSHVTAHGRRTDSRVGTAIVRPGCLAIYHGGSSLFQCFGVFSCTRPALSPAVFSLHYSPLRTAPPRFPIHRFSSSLPDLYSLFSILYYLSYQPSQSSLPILEFLPLLINPRHYLFPIFSPYHLPLSTLSIISSGSPCRSTISHYA
jgi:hypothetical protein